eukprot:6018101-Lingulodinium_polyedra.AAC.1
MDNPRPVFAMPTVAVSGKHRARDNAPMFSDCVARPVSKGEMFNSPQAVEAMKIEWERLWDKNVWDNGGVREWSEVAREAQRKGVT